MNTRSETVLFDLDGTLVDTAPDIVMAANHMLDEFGAAALPFETVSGFIGKGVPNLVRRTLEAAGLNHRVDAESAEAIFHRHYSEGNGHFSQVYPGVEKGLSELARQGYRLACVTNKPVAPAARLLALTGLAGYFEVLVGGDSLAQMKPDPEPLRHACRLLEVEVEQSVMVGDSPIDVAAARAAGIPVYVVRYGYAGPDGAEALTCDGLIDSCAVLPTLLASATQRRRHRETISINHTEARIS
ncbi:phosphoglycolate phosphatase [Paraburkholderia aromaticivorans]|uniref:Phosphoglycolate phosphatase n=1 Tax=Paraburkholderia aromaticivorans TaxID=2026199 RepID=A0A248VY27_9BURK|nr:phosphoglycolate phosphatase [Paraburkholderia aromaticivorans]ASW03924.1 phosphoglycolate phosphatase [Paraburkholderia aromaticivorans]